MRLWNGRTAVLAVAGTIAVATVASAASGGGDVSPTPFGTPTAATDGQAVGW